MKETDDSIIEEERNDSDSNININKINDEKTEKSDSMVFPEMPVKPPNNNEQNEHMKDYIKHNFSNINPLRGIHIRKMLKERSLKRKAVLESVVNLKTQYILFNIRDFIRRYQIQANPKINTIAYKFIRFIRNISLFIYGILMFFEKPWFCYDKATLPLPSFFKFSKDCEERIVFNGFPFINHYAIRGIEFTITLIILIAQLFKYRNEYLLKDTNIGMNKHYNIIQIILFVSLSLCIIDLIISIIAIKFPIINFILRPFICIYMIRRIRRNWVSIGKILWKTKTVFIFLLIVIFLFSFIGYFLFKRTGSEYFKNIHETVLQLYILLSTCNFPDIMLDTFQISKWGIFYFIIYISINYFIILSYLKTLYYTKYYKVNKHDCLDIIKNIIDNDYNKEIFKVKQFRKFILSQKKIYFLNEEEYNNVLILVNLYEQNNKVFNDLSRIIENNPENEMISKTLYGSCLLHSRKFEVTVNLLCILTMLIASYNNIPILTIQFVWSFLILFELFILIKNIGIKRFVFRHFNRVIFHIFNLFIIICIITLIILNEMNEYGNERYNHVFKVLKIFISLRTVRIFVFLDKFVVIKNIYTMIRNSKEMFYRNLFTLYSLFLLFSTFSILLTGGNIEKNIFKDDKIDSIPQAYEHINFNDFSSSFITCFCLLMVNNLNILVKSLTYHINNNKIIFQFYFATFYFFSTLIIINIIQTLLLELYLNSDYSMSDKRVSDDKKESKNEIENDNDNDNNEIDNISYDDSKEAKEMENKGN